MRQPTDSEKIGTGANAGALRDGLAARRREWHRISSARRTKDGRPRPKWATVVTDKETPLCFFAQVPKKADRPQPPPMKPQTPPTRAQKLFRQPIRAPLLLALGQLLGGCGAVGGGAHEPPARLAGAATAPAPPAPAQSLSDAVRPAPVTAPTYRPGTPQRGAWDYLISQRASCGFGPLQQDNRADTAASAHASYLVKTSLEKGVGVSGHTEDATSPHFYGASPAARLLRAGFPVELGSYEIVNTHQLLQNSKAPPKPLLGEEMGAGLMRNLIESVYHARGAFVAGRRAGAGAAVGTAAHAVAGAPDGRHFTASALVLDFSNDGSQRLGKGQIATYPCAGSTTVGGAFTPSTESPNPYPDAGRRAVYGTPIYFKADVGARLVIGSATLVQVSTGASLPYRQMTQANDPHGQVGAHEAFLTPTAALAPGGRYTVNATGWLDGAAFTKTFTFATAP